MNIPRILLRAALPALLFAPAAAVWAQAAQAAQPAIVGEATMVIGMARIVSADGGPRNVERGMPIRVGDRVETEAGGHVHYRFVDGGRISIRPSSRLQIESYNNSGSALTAIKFRLDEGVVRSITGAWGEAARDRFRLNTPVAAIGVKGTDFVVRSDAEKTSASVYTGAIVVAPLAGCAAALGPCRTASERLLSEDMKGQMVELSRNQASPQLVPLVDLLAHNRRMGPSEAQQAKIDKPIVAASPREDLAADKSVVNESRTAVVVASSSAAATVPTVVIPVPPLIRQLAWGRWEWVKPMEGDTLSRTFAVATENGRLGTVGNGAYGLYRIASADNALLQTTDTSANFRLNGGVAQLSMPDGRGTSTQPVKVDSGTLNVDFTRSTFATSLNVSNPAIGAQNLQANGIVRPNGYLIGQGGNTYVAGALSLDAKEAGYFFERALSAGNLTGITLWGK